MLTPAALVLLALWILGALYSDIGPYIHVLAVLAVVLLGLRYFQGRRGGSTLNR